MQRANQSRYHLSLPYSHKHGLTGMKTYLSCNVQTRHVPTDAGFQDSSSGMYVQVTAVFAHTNRKFSVPVPVTLLFSINAINKIL